MHRRKRASGRLATLFRVVATTIAFWLAATLTSAAIAQTPNCHAGTLVTVVAHLDDDLLFVNPGISDKLAAGWCVTTVHLIGGANGANFDYVKLRERGTRLAYSRMAGVPDEWIETTVDIAGKPVHQMLLKDQPRVKLLELRMPGGGVRGGKVPLGLLWDQGATIETYPLEADGTNTVTYDRKSLIASVREILSSATEIYTLNPDTVPFIEHPDHIYAARITRVAAQQLGRDMPIGYHVTYPTGGLPKNLDAADTQKKRDDVASYFAIDGDDNGGHVFGEYQWDGNWVARRYWTRAHASDPGPDFQPHPMQLVNEYSGQCLNSAGPGATPRLAACRAGQIQAQQWQWHQVAGTPGANHTAQLVDTATQQCVAERGNGLVEERCNADDPAQKWTPWDFGIVHTPLGHCLAAHRGALVAGGCSSVTAESRWSPSSKTQWTDIREQGAMFGDVHGDGQSNAVYVQRRKDGPGFNVWVAGMSRLETAESWYLNKVPFDPKATAPTCSGATLCFDSVRFLVGDFDGDGRADLMVIAPAADKQGTSFWLMRSDGERFEAPKLWLQTSALSMENAQQYVAGDFPGTGRASLMVANKREGGGLDLWVATSDGETGRAPVLWSGSNTLNDSARFVPIRESGSKRAGLIAIDATNNAMTLTSLSSSGSAFSARPSKTYSQFSATMTKIAAGDTTGNGTDDLVLLQPRGDGPDIDVWTLAIADVPGMPVKAGTLSEASYADALPAVVTHEHRQTLVLFKRANTQLDGFYYTAGAPMLIGYEFDANRQLGPAEIWAEMPGQFSESLWLENLWP